MKNTTINNIETREGQSAETIQALMQRDIADIKVLVTDIQISLKTDYATKAQIKPIEENYVDKKTFDPVQKIVYGFTTLILTAFFVALIGLVITTTKG